MKNKKEQNYCSHNNTQYIRRQLICGSYITGNIPAKVAYSKTIKLLITYKITRYFRYADGVPIVTGSSVTSTEGDIHSKFSSICVNMSLTMEEEHNKKTNFLDIKIAINHRPLQHSRYKKLTTDNSIKKANIIPRRRTKKNSEIR